MHGFVQVPCPKCSTTTWISPQAGFAMCPKCQTQVAAPAGAAPAPGGATPPVPVTMPAAYSRGAGGHRLRAVGMVAGIVVLGAGSVAFMTLKNKFLGTGKKDTAGYAALGLDPDKPDGDKMITSVADRATKWKKDAYFWSVNYQAVHADGTVDVSEGAEVQYISPSRVVKSSKKDRQDSIRKFSFGPNGADYSQQWDAINEWKNVEKPEAPGCSIKDLTKKLEKDGLTGKKTVRITFDPQFDWKHEQMWHVIGKDPNIDAHYSMKTCDKIEE